MVTDVRQTDRELALQSREREQRGGREGSLAQPGQTGATTTRAE